METTRYGHSLIFASFIAVASLFVFAGCTDFFTTSLGEAFARDPDYSSLSYSELIDAAKKHGAKDSAAAKEIMKQLASVEPERLKSLSAEDKTAVLNTSANAAYSLDSVLDLIDDLKARSDSGEDLNTGTTVDMVFDLFDKSVDVTAAEVLLNDTHTRETVPVDTLILATASLMASVNEEDEQSIREAVEKKDSSGLTGNTLDTSNTVIGVVQALEKRHDEVAALGDSLGFDLSLLLPGFGEPAADTGNSSGS